MRTRETAARWVLGGLLAASTGCYTGGGHGGGEDEGEGDAGQADDAADDGENDDADGEGGDDGVPAECDGQAPPRAALLRMSRTHYVHALEAVFGADAVDHVRIAVEAMPAPKAGVFAAEVPPPTYSEVAATIDIASRLAHALTAQDSALAALSPCLTSVPAGADPSTDACIGEFLDDYGPRMLRRPLSDEDRTRLHGDYEVGGEHSVNEGIATLIIALMIDPSFLYFVETRGEAVGDGVLALTPHETAAKLARVLWSSVPDDELSAAADAGLSDDALAEQIERMLDDDRARAAIGEFYRDWLDLANLPFPSEALVPDPDARAELRDAMEAELLEFVRATTFDREGTYADLLLDRRASIESPELASIYGVAPGSDVNLPAGERAGLLTRAAFLATAEIRGSNAGHLIKRGHRLSSLLCRPLPLPDPDNFPQDDPADPESNPDVGIRERFTEATAEPQCAACHVQLDGLGAPLGHYGSTGQWIELETIELASGQTADLPIDTQSEVQLDDDPLSVADGVALSEALASSKVGAHCLAQHLTRNIVARVLSPDDTCMVAVASETLAPTDAEPQSIRAALVALLMSDHFRRISIQ